jgi:aryl-alcohol dehydrogenase-like predicted oxidoreductase
MDTQPYGRTDLAVSRLGLGAGALGDPALTEREAEALLGAALDEGVTLIDTARSYGPSEERLGRHLGARRHQVVLSTKGGYGIAGVPDWTGEAVARGIDEALDRLRTDRIDIFHLHSCPLTVLVRDDILDTLDRARAAGKVRALAYSGENDALGWAAASGRFDGLQCSVSPFDQRNLRELSPLARARGLGLIAKRPLGKAPWRACTDADDDAANAYRHRLQAMALDPAPLGWPELCVRFSAFAAGVSSILVGTTRIEHVRCNAELVRRGPLPDATCASLAAAFCARDDGWLGLV